MPQKPITFMKRHVENDVETKSNEVFFMSESLEGILEIDDVGNESSLTDANEDNHLTGNFVSLSLRDSKLTIECTDKEVKMLLKNPQAVFVYDFMEITWVLTTNDMYLKCIRFDCFHVTMTVMQRR